MKKILNILPVFILLLFTSCQYLNGTVFDAEYWNHKFGFDAPMDQSYIMVYSDNGTDVPDSFQYPLDENLNEVSENQYPPLKLSLDEMLKNKDFADWYNKLSNKNYRKLGLRKELEEDLLEGVFSINRKTGSLRVYWDVPVTSIKIYSYADSDYFEYELPEPLYYGETAVVSFGDLYKRSDFLAFVNKIDIPNYNYPYVTGISTYSRMTTDTLAYKSVFASQSSTVFYLVWNRYKLETNFTVHAENGTASTFSFDVGPAFDWYSSSISLDEMLDNSEFKTWYDSLTFDSYTIQGIYKEGSSELYSGSDSFTMYGTRDIYICWDNPLTTLTIHSNFDKTTYRSARYVIEEAQDQQAFIITLKEPIPFGEYSYFNLIKLLKEYPDFKSWIDNIQNSPNSTRPYVYGVTDYSGKTGNYTCSISRWNHDLYLSWGSTKYVYGTTVYSNLQGKEDSYFLWFDDLYYDKYCSWSSNIFDDDFMAWYNSLTDEDYFVRGINNRETYEPGDSIVVPRGDSGYFYINSENPDIYVVWREYVQNIRIHMNLDSSASSDSDYRTFYLSGKYQSIWLNWNDFLNLSGFQTWYDGLTNGNLQKLGLHWSADNDDDYVDCSDINLGSILITENNQDFYVQWRRKISSFTISTEDGTDSFTFELDDEYVKKELWWDDLCQNQQFVQWFEGLEAPEGYYIHSIQYAENPEYPENWSYRVGPSWGGYIYVNRNLQNYTVYMKPYITQIRISSDNADSINGTINSVFTFELDPSKFGTDLKSVSLSWQDFISNGNFKSWYQNLSKGNYKKVGLAGESDYWRDDEICNETNDNIVYISENNQTVYVQWRDYY